MALSPKDRYPGQFEIGSSWWPFGKAKNKTTVGDNDGTPWEKDLVNDWLGFFQALLTTAGITPSGNPDRVGASQYVDALEQRINAGTSPIETALDALTERVQALEITNGRLGVFYVDASQTVAVGDRIGLTEALDPDSYYTESSNRITVGNEGYYELSATVRFQSQSPNPISGAVGFMLKVENSDNMLVISDVLDGNAFPQTLSVSTIVHITNKDTQRFNLVASGTPGASLVVADGIVILNRIR